MSAGSPADFALCAGRRVSSITKMENIDSFKKQALSLSYGITKTVCPLRKEATHETDLAGNLRYIVSNHWGIGISAKLIKQ